MWPVHGNPKNFDLSFASDYILTWCFFSVNTEKTKSRFRQVGAGPHGEVGVAWSWGGARNSQLSPQTYFPQSWEWWLSDILKAPPVWRKGILPSLQSSACTLIHNILSKYLGRCLWSYTPWTSLGGSQGQPAQQTWSEDSWECSLAVWGDMVCAGSHSDSTSLWNTPWWKKVEERAVSSVLLNCHWIFSHLACNMSAVGLGEEYTGMSRYELT